MRLTKLRKKRSSKLGLSPVISSVIMTGAMIAILSVALGFANNFLWTRIAESDYTSSKQLMQSVGLQIDDVAWTTGRTGTINYATQYGDVELETDVLTYTVSVETDSGPVPPYVLSTGVIMFNMPTYHYSISDDYWVQLYPHPAYDTSLVLTGTSAPIARVFEVEQVPMYDGDYIRVVAAPAIRVLYSSISSTTTNAAYVRMYLPILSAGESPRIYQSLTLRGESVQANTLNKVNSISVTVDFPKSATGFDNEHFFNFPETEWTFDFSSYYAGGYDNVVLELYLSEVSVGFGL
ncbi:MAG: hypothetical protein IAX21_08160 [Candidatus Bathyarchaeota archaeon]|nr:MAG: hypothetical protein IAX21_08160 [Candidatus Bathyarchaeota archaeon]